VNVDTQSGRVLDAMVAQLVFGLVSPSDLEVGAMHIQPRKKEGL